MRKNRSSTCTLQECSFRWRTSSPVRVLGSLFRGTRRRMSEALKHKARDCGPQCCFMFSSCNCGTTEFLASNLGSCRGGFFRNFENGIHKMFCQICRQHCYQFFVWSFTLVDSLGMLLLKFYCFFCLCIWLFFVTLNIGMLVPHVLRSIYSCVFCEPQNR